MMLPIKRQRIPSRTKGRSRRRMISSGVSLLLLIIVCINIKVLFHHYREEQSENKVLPGSVPLPHDAISLDSTRGNTIGHVTPTINKRNGGGEDVTRDNANDSLEENDQAKMKGVHPPRAVIAYAISITDCSVQQDESKFILQGAAVLKHSIHLSSWENPTSDSRYGYKMFAFVHPDGAPCADDLTKLGYEVQIRQTPINVSDIRGDFLRRTVAIRGCCQEKEFLKLYMYQLTDYPVVVHLDIDTLVLQPMDELFDAMLSSLSSFGGGHDSTPAQPRNIPVMHNMSLPNDIHAFFTRDYNLVPPTHEHPGVQGGFLVVRPSHDAFQEYIDIILEGDHRPKKGWGGLGYGGYYGAQQIQGICSYFYDHRHPGTAVELNRCVYNVMVDSPVVSDKMSKYYGRCRDGKETCEDCRNANVANIKTAHFTICGKPWLCRKDVRVLCAKLHHEWFRVRKKLDESRGYGLNTDMLESYKTDHFLGYCSRPGPAGYIPFQI